MVYFLAIITTGFKEKPVELQEQISIAKENTEETTEVESLKTETASVSETRVPSFSDTPKSTTLQEDEQQVQLRRQIVSLGKQPKAQQIRRKKDMVSIFCNFSFHLKPNRGDPDSVGLYCTVVIYGH